MKIYKDDYKHFRTCQKLTWFLNAKNYLLAKKLINEKQIINFVELTHTKTSSKFDNHLITISDLDYLNFADQKFNDNEADDDFDFYDGESIIDGLETGKYAQAYFQKYFQCFNFENIDITNMAAYLNNSATYDVLFEPRFEYEGCVTKCDILKRNHDGWDLIEVKAVTWVKEEHMWDLLYQFDILNKCGIKIINVYIMYIKNNYVRKEKLDLDELFIVNGSTWQKTAKSKKNANLYDTIQTEILTHDLANEYQMIKKILKLKNYDEIYEFLISPYCHEDNEKYCSHIFKYFSVHNTIFELYRLWKTKKALWYYQEGLLAINDPKLLSFITSKLHLRQYDVIKNGEKLIDLNYLNILKQEINKYQYPVYMYDFETMKSAIPKFTNSMPYQQIPFQYSIHVLLAPDFNFKTNVAIKHYQFLADGETDPRISLIENLCSDLIKTHGIGTYVAYNQSFEKSIIKNLINFFPQYQAQLTLIHHQTIDLQDFFKNFKIYKTEFYGSISIKKTLPAFEPTFSYEDLAIKKGDMAAEAFRRRIENNITLTNWNNNFRESMLKYCARDTLGMVVLFWHIKKQIQQVYINDQEGQNNAKS